jgi:hypothetical protein
VSPELVDQSSEAARAVLVVADPFRDEVERCRRDQGNPWRLIDDVAVDPLPESGSQNSAMFWLYGFAGRNGLQLKSGAKNPDGAG